MWKFSWKKDKDKFLILLLAGLLLLVLGIPQKQEIDGQNLTYDKTTQTSGNLLAMGEGEKSYEERMEKRLKNILEQVEGVGKVEVMLVLQTSEEKVFLTDRTSSGNEEVETGENGVKNQTKTWEESLETVLTGNSEEEGALVQKEISPKIEGVMICAQGAGDARIRAEISEAAEALFGVPPHKIKVLKRVE